MSMRFIQVDGNYINIDHIVIVKSGYQHTVIQLSNGDNIYTKDRVSKILWLIEMAEKRGKEVSR